jgi:RNA polymerase sigma-70 factor (ECF subfamily)
MAALDVLDEKAQVDEIVNSHQELQLMSAVVADLPKRIRQAFTLRRVYGFSQQEIAQHMGISETTVEQLLVRAVRRCADALFAREVAADRPESMSERLRRRLKRH